MAQEIFRYECPECGEDEIEIGQNFYHACGEPFEWIEEYDLPYEAYEEKKQRIL